MSVVPWTEIEGSNSEMFRTSFITKDVQYFGFLFFAKDFFNAENEKETYWRLEIAKKLNDNQEIILRRKFDKNMTFLEIQEKADKDFYRMHSDLIYIPD